MIEMYPPAVALCPVADVNFAEVARPHRTVRNTSVELKGKPQSGLDGGKFAATEMPDHVAQTLGSDRGGLFHEDLRLLAVDRDGRPKRSRPSRP